MAPGRCFVHVAAPLGFDEVLDAGLLSQAERERAARFAEPIDRDRFTTAAVLLRRALARHAGTEASEVVIDRTCTDCGEPHGRPNVVAPAGWDASISHSGSVVAVAVTDAGRVGVDVEAIDDGRVIVGDVVNELVDVVCTPHERAAVHDRAALLSVWCRKEAVLKATGEGLRRAMTELVVTAPHAPAGLVALDGSHAGDARWTLTDLKIAGHAGAVAVAVNAQRLHATVDCTVDFTVIDADRTDASLVLNPAKEPAWPN